MAAAQLEYIGGVFDYENEKLHIRLRIADCGQKIYLIT
jgi:hypothetical protein